MAKQFVSRRFGRQQQKHIVIAAIEACEARRLLAASITNRELLVDGGATADTVSLASASSAQIEVTLNGTSQFFDYFQFDTLRINGGDGSDTITVHDGLSSLVNGITINGDLGDDTIIGSDHDETIFGGGGDDFVHPGRGNDALRGDGGVNTVDYGDRSANLTVRLDNLGPSGDLGAGEHDGVGEFSVAITGSGNDLLIGNAGLETLLGNDGDDTLDGGANNDYLNGGLGNDTVSYASRTATVIINLTTQQGGTFGETDTYSAIDNAIGGAGNDTLTGGNSDNILEGGKGSDSIFGGGGRDTVSYAGETTKVQASFALNDGIVDGDPSTDVFVDCENMLGGSAGDSLEGGPGDNVLDGGAGNDTITTAAGSDTIIGGAGLDVVDYGGRASGVRVTIGSGSDDGESGEHGDVDASIEAVLGSNGDDTMIGDAHGNYFYGGPGADSIDGGDGNDTMDGGNGNNTMIGGDGKDRLTGGDDGDTIDGGHGPDIIAGGDNGNDSLLGGPGRDRIGGSNGNDRIKGGSGGDTISGFGGNDTMYGDTGNDKLFGDRDADQLFGGSGTDFLDGGSEADRLFGESGSDTLVGTDRIGPDEIDATADRLDGGLSRDSLQGPVDALDKLVSIEVTLPS